MLVTAAQIFILEFSKDGSANLQDEFVDGGAANQPLILQGGVGLSNGQVSHHYCQFQSFLSGFLKLMTDFLMRWIIHSSMRSKKAGGILTKFWFPGMSVCMRSA